MANDNEVRRIKVGDDLYVLAMSGSSRGADQMRKQAAESMKRVRERDADNEEPDSGG